MNIIYNIISSKKNYRASIKEDDKIIKIIKLIF